MAGGPRSGNSSPAVAATAKAKATTPQPKQRKVWPSRSRGSCPVDDGDVSPPEGDVPKVKLNLDNYTKECIESMRSGFDYEAAALKSRPCMAQLDWTKPCNFARARYMEQLSKKWPKDVEPTVLKDHNFELFKIVPAKTTTTKVPTLDDTPSGEYSSSEFETHNAKPRIMCLPCMTFAPARHLWGTIARPDTRPSRKQSAFSALHQITSTKSGGNFKTGHCRTAMHMQCMASFCDISDAKSEAEKKIKAGGDTQCEKLGVQADWSIDAPHDGDEPMHFRLHCNICHQSLATKALPACDWEAVIKAHLLRPKNVHAKVVRQASLNSYFGSGGSGGGGSGGGGSGSGRGDMSHHDDEDMATMSHDDEDTMSHDDEDKDEAKGKDNVDKGKDNVDEGKDEATVINVDKGKGKDNVDKGKGKDNVDKGKDNVDKGKDNDIRKTTRKMSAKDTQKGKRSRKGAQETSAQKSPWDRSPA